MTKTPVFALILFVIISSFYACTKGDTGPAGAAGTAGNANVQSSVWTSLRMSFSSSDSSYEQTITADSLTQAIIDSGVVLTYMKVTSGTQTLFVNAGPYLSPIITVGTINLFSPYDYSGFSFRYVLIKASSLLNGRVASSNLINGYTKEQWKAMSYDEVIAKLNQK